MLRYIFLKLSGFTSKKEFSISSSCNQMLMFRSSSSVKGQFRREGRKLEQSRPQHKRSYSFPSRFTKSNSLLDNESVYSRWTKTEPLECQGIYPSQRKSIHQSIKAKGFSKSPCCLKSVSSQALSTNLIKKTQPEKEDRHNKYHEMSSFNESDRYQLEAARPRRSRSELVFNVFDYVAKDVDLTDYLQPSNLRPFGSNDNIYLPLLMSHKNLNLTTENNPEYLQSIGDLENPEQDNSKVEEDVTRKKTEPIQSNAVNKIKETQYKNSKPYKEIIGKHKELNPLFIPTPKIEKNHATLKKLKEKPQVSQNATHNEKVSKKNKTPSERYEPPVPKSSIAIEPPPFLTKREDMFPTISFVDMGLGTKRNMANYRRMQTPFPAYSDHVKNMAKKHLTDYLDGLKKDNHNNDVDTQESTQRKQSTVQAHNINTIKVKTVDDKPKALKKHEMIKNNVPQRRALSTEHAYSNINASPSSTTVSKPAKSSIYTSNSLNKNPVTQSLISLNTRRVNLSSSQSYAKSSANVRKFEPKPCKTPEKRKRCFLPSKVRLKPPKCITKHYEDCVPKSDCPPRADDCLRFCPKKLPPLKDDDCKCFEPEIPSQNPKLKRLAFKFFDEPRTPRVCPCEPVKCPCPPPPRADELTKPKEKKLPVYVPGYCECIERPPMTNAPLIRLKKVVCEPEERCWPKKVCVVEKCEEKERADDCLVEYVKPLPLLTMGDCSCTEAMMPNENPKMRRLNFEYEDPPRVCPCETPCECPEPPVRADDCLEEKTKKLPAIEVKECACIEPPPMIDVPLKRLKKVCIPEEVCRPKRECPVEPCECKFRADMCLEEEAKKLPKLEPTGCECFEPHVPNQIPKLKRLHMKFVDEPRICPCEPTKCPCPPPPPRSDELAPPKQKKLPVHVPDECKCVERPPMIDIPLIRLKKVCEPEDRCWPKKPCVVEEKCEMKERADDYLCERPKSLRPIQLKPCPCIDLKLKEAPKLKRLSFSVPEPPRICPIEVCPPPPEKCTRADDCAPQKVKQLRAIKLGDCPCVDHPMTDVKPLPRLKCKEDPEECHCEDPCLEYPRADWGCWEYLQDVEPPDKCDKNKEKVYLNYKQKRKFNTDCRVSIQNSIKVKDVGYQMLNSSSKWNLNSEIPKKDLKQRENKPLQDNKVSHIPRNININKTSTLKSTKTAKTEENDKTHITKLGRLHRNNSLPTLFLLKELNKMEKNTKNSNLKHGKSKKSDSTSIFTKLTQNSLVSSSMRNLSTVVTDAKKTTSCYLGAAPASSDRNKNHKDAQETNVYGKKTYLKITKSLANPIAARNCPPKEQRTCVKKRIPVCCEKKQTPNLSFSECMDEEIEPFSNNSQWSCGKKEYGFEPKPKHLNEPLDTVKEKKKLSTSAAHGENTTSDLQLLNVKNPVVNYFSARYSKTEWNGQSRKYTEDILAKDVTEKITQKDSSSLSNGASDVTNCRIDKNDSVSVKGRYSKLMNQKSNYAVAETNCRKMSTQSKEYATLQFNSSGLLPFRPSFHQNVSRKHMSTVNNIHITENIGKTTFCFVDPSHRQYSKDEQKLNCRCKSPKKKRNCPKFELTNCPEIARDTCRREIPEHTCIKRPQAPYPSFSELMDDKMEDRLTECPMEKENIHRLQPKFPIPLNKPPIINPMDLQQGRVDPTLEENCVRERLYIKNDGLTQDCQTFGQYTKPLRSKHFIKERNTDCDKIEKLKQLGKWPPKNVRNLSTYISSTFDFQRRNFCSSAHVLIMNKDENLKETDPENENEIQKLKSERARSFHALCKKPQIILTEEADKEVCQNQLMEIDEFCKNVKFRNVQWRMDNFQKWYRLKKKNKLSHVIKKYHTCSKLKYRSFVRSTQNSQCLSTTTVKTRVRNSNVRGVICSKLKFRRLQRNKLAPKHLSISTVRTPVDDSSTQKGISTAKSRAINKKQKIIRFPLYPKPIKKTPSIKIPNLPEQMKRVELTSERDEKDNGQPLRLNDCRSMRTWQPKYPGVPEVDTPTIPRHKPKNDPSWEKECLIHFTEKEKGKSWDCSALEKPFIRLNTSSMEARALASKEDTANCFPCGEVFIRSNKVQRKTKSPPGRRLRATKCHKSSNLCPPVSKHQFKLPCPALPKLNFDIPPKILQSPVVLGLWQKVVNYFKAKPNCPSPDEWKKRALREKAERAAKAAGLCLIDPEDLQKTLSKKSNRRGAIDSNQGCFPTRKNPCKTTTRNYSSGVDWGNTEELNKLLEEEKKKQLAKKLSRILKDESNLDDDVNLKCPDPLFESILKEVILKRNSLSCLEKLADREVEDECFGYCLKIVPSNINAFDECVRESSTEESKFDQSEQISDYQKYFSKIDSLSEITYEELENMKTKTLVKELDKLLKENEKPQKKS